MISWLQASVSFFGRNPEEIVGALDSAGLHSIETERNSENNLRMKHTQVSIETTTKVRGSGTNLRQM